MTVTLHEPDREPRATGAAPGGEKPSEQIIAKANAVREVTDARGRVIRFKKLGALDTMDLNEIAGAGNSMNAGWMVFATIAFSVVAIDGEKVMRPANKAQLRALVARLGDEGIDAVFAEVMPKQDDAAEQDADRPSGPLPDAETDRAKNS